MASIRSFAVLIMALVAAIGLAYFSPAAAMPDNSKRDTELLKCLTEFDDDCRVAIAAWIMFEDAIPPSVRCCSRLVDTGMKCHDALVDRFIESKKYKGEADDVIRRSDELWEFCAFEKLEYPYGDSPIDTSAPSPVPNYQ